MNRTAAPSWLLSVTHRSGYRYAGTVFRSYNEARVTPRTDAGQQVIDASVEVSPAPSLFRYVDYFGTVVTAFDLHVPHTELNVTATCVVETSEPSTPGPSCPWSALEDPKLRDELTEYLEAAPRTTVDAEELFGVVDLVRAERDPHAGAMAAANWVYGRLEYVRGATGVQTHAAEVLRLGRGVCQDFAHVTIAILRAAGIPTRYVSGYLHPDPQALPGRTTHGESHAWVEWWAGDWRAYDPTNVKQPGLGYVTLARGRDYGDVSPLKGIYHGGSAEALGVSVEVTRLR